MESLRLTPQEVHARLPEPSAQERIRELEHVLELERGRRAAIEQGLDRLSARCADLARENAELRDLLAAAPAGA